MKRRFHLTAKFLWFGEYKTKDDTEDNVMSPNASIFKRKEVVKIFFTLHNYLLCCDYSIHPFFYLSMFRLENAE